MAQATERVFLFLQGPHGPFYRRLADALLRRGARVRRAAFNAADLAEWSGRGPADAWDGSGSYRSWIEGLLRTHGITDIVVYGDTRPVHGIALEAAAEAGLVTHRFEEGYLRPSWITYERQGTNGASPARLMPLAAMMRALSGRPERPGTRTAPSSWGATREHLAWSALYHARVLIGGNRGTSYRGHRALPLSHEAALYVRRMSGTLGRPIRRAAVHRRIARASGPYHVALLQLSFDCSMAAHGPYGNNADMVSAVVRGFAAGAPPHHHLVFRTHPFEDGRERLGRLMRRLARDERVAGRIHLLDGGGGLDDLLDGASSAVTVNSTAGHQVLSRGLPLLALGDAVYSREGLVQTGDVAAFFEEPVPPDAHHYRIFRRYLLETSQIPGSFYSARGIGEALSRLPDVMLREACPYGRLWTPALNVLRTVAPMPAVHRPEPVLCS